MSGIFRKKIPNRNVVGHIEFLEGINQISDGLNSIVKFDKDIKGNVYQVSLSRLCLEERKSLMRGATYYPWPFSVTPGFEEDLKELHTVLERLKMRLSSIGKKEIENSIKILKFDSEMFKKNMIPSEEETRFMFFQMTNGEVVLKDENIDK